MPFDKALQLEAARSQILQPLIKVDDPNTEKSCQIDFLTLADCERQSCGISTNYHPLEYLKLAADIAISDTFAYQCAAGNINTTNKDDKDIVFAHLSDRIIVNERTKQQDACTQVIRWGRDEMLPSQDISQTTRASDFSTQCELLTADQMEDRGAELMTLGEPRKSVTFMETGVWVNQSDMAISCYLLPESVVRTTPITVRLPCLTDMVTQAVTDTIHALSLEALVQPVRVNQLVASTARCLLEKLHILMSSHDITQAKLANWIHSIGFLKEVNNQLRSKIEEAKKYMKQGLETVELTAEERLLVPEEGEDDSTTVSDAEPKNVETILNRRQLKQPNYSIQFLSVLQDIPVKPEKEAIIEEPTPVNEDDADEKISKINAGLRKVNNTKSPASKDTSQAPGSTWLIPKSKASNTEQKKGITKKSVTKGVNKTTRASLSWQKVKALTIERKKSEGELLRMKRMEFLDDLMGQLSSEETNLLQAIFMTINTSNSSFISVDELCHMLTEAFTLPFPIPIGRKIMEVIDVDQDGYLCLLDLFGLFYLTEIYMQALGDGFRDVILTDTVKSFTACHAVVFIALSELCFFNGYRLSAETNIFIRQCEKSNVLRCNGDFDGIELKNLDSTVCRMYCFSLLGLDGGVLESICDGVSDIGRLRVSPMWPENVYDKPKYSKKSERFEFSDVVLTAWIEHRNINLRSSFFDTLTHLSKPKLPLISLRNEVGLKPPYIFWQHGRDSLLRVVETGKGIEGHEISRAHVHTLGILQNLDAASVTLAQMFLEKPLFHNKKLHNVVKTFCFNAMPMWPRGTGKRMCKKLSMTAETQRHKIGTRSSLMKSVNPYSPQTSYTKTQPGIVQMESGIGGKQSSVVRPQTSRIAKQSSMKLRQSKTFQQSSRPQVSLVHTETIAESVLPFIQTEVTEKPIDLAVKGLRKKLVHKYGRHSLTYANIGGIRRKKNTIQDKVCRELQKSSAYESMMLWKDTETKLREENKTDCLPRILGLHTTYMPFKASKVYLPKHGWQKPVMGDEMVYKHYTHVTY